MAFRMPSNVLTEGVAGCTYEGCIIIDGPHIPISASLETGVQGGFQNSFIISDHVAIDRHVSRANGSIGSLVVTRSWACPHS